MYNNKIKKFIKTLFFNFRHAFHYLDKFGGKIISECVIFTVFVFLSRIKELKDKLIEIGEKVSNTDLVTITLKGMLEEYHMFITSLATWEKDPTFDDVIGILLQEEERRKILRCGSQNLDLVLLAKGKQPYRGKP